MQSKGIILCVVLAVFMCMPARAEAMLLIHEILADPPRGLSGDANGDGVGSSSQDEFVELFNADVAAKDISGWSLSDALKARHVFAPQTVVGPQELLVVFGGGNPQLNVNWQVATTGTLGLNNTGDTVSLFDANQQLIDQVSYGKEGGADQSLVRFPEREGELFAPHLDLTLEDPLRYSPGTFAVPLSVGPEDSLPPTAAVPERSTLCYLGLGLGLLFLSFRKGRSYSLVIK